MNNQEQTSAAPALGMVKSFIIGLAAAVFMIYPIFPIAPYAYAVICAFLVCAYTVNKQGFPLTLILSAFAFLLTGASPVLFANVLALVAAAAAGGTMLCSKRSAVIYVILTALVYAVPAVLVSPITALSALTSFPAAIALAVCIKKRARRISAICVISAVFAITLTVPTALLFYLEHGADSAEQFAAILDSVKTTLNETLTATYNELAASTDSKITEIISADSIASSLDAIFPLIPAIFIIISNLFAFSIHTVSLWTRARVGQAPKECETHFEMSKLSAWLYIISFIIPLFGASRSELSRTLITATECLNLILAPSFLYLGILSALALFRPAAKKRRTAHTVILILAFLYCGTFLIYPLIAFGVISSLKSKNGNKQNPQA